MTEPVIVAVPPKGGSLDDVLRRLARVGWLRQDLVDAVRALVREDKRRIKLEEGLISLDGIVDGYVFLYRQLPRAWTFELDVRTSKERW